MTVRYPTQCSACTRLRRDSPKQTPACDAFPGGIPNSISYYGGDHRKPRKGDHGLRFEQVDSDEARENFADWQFIHAPEEWQEAQRGDQAAGGQEGRDEA